MAEDARAQRSADGAAAVAAPLGDTATQVGEGCSAEQHRLHERWACGFHIAPARGWLNDPNGLCQFRGEYHVFHQYSPAWPEPGAPRGWGHAVSRDLVRWEHRGMAIAPDTPEEASGAYSGSAAVVPGAARDGGDLLRLYYTGNVKEPGDYDYIHAGRQANELLIETEDGTHLSPKRVLLRNADYPPTCTCHVRDPKVWRQDGAWWMVLGARDVFDRGQVLLYRSDDGVAWHFYSIVRPRGAFGFMWECPDRIELSGREYLSICPQGMADRPWAEGQRDQAVYIPLKEGRRLIDGEPVNEEAFRLWDHGFDFYAPQTFTDDSGRVIMIGWMGKPEVGYESAPEGLPWCHCLTVPRVLTREPGGGIAQAPAPELEALRREAHALASDVTCRCAGRRADIAVEGIVGAFSLLLDGALEIRYEMGMLTCAFIDCERVGAGRTRRRCAVDAVSDLRVLVDGSAVEVFAADGRIAFATRWFPRAERLTVRFAGTCATAQVWEMASGMGAGFDR